MVKAHRISFVTIAPKAKRKKSGNGVQYIFSTLQQFSKAKIEGTDMFYCDNAKELAKDLRKKEKGWFDRWGRPTSLGLQKRKEELAKLELPETATLIEVVQKQFETRSKGMAQKLVNLTKQSNLSIPMQTGL